MSAIDEVEAASDRLYAAMGELLTGRPEKLADVWLQDETATYAHPFGGSFEGWTAIWQRFLADAAVLRGGVVRLDERVIHAFGDVAYTLGVEHAVANYGEREYAYVSQVTNIYRKVQGRWLLVHHHVDIAPSKLP